MVVSLGLLITKSPIPPLIVKFSVGVATSAFRYIHNRRISETFLLGQLRIPSVFSLVYIFGSLQNLPYSPCIVVYKYKRAEVY